MGADPGRPEPGNDWKKKWTGATKQERFEVLKSSRTSKVSGLP